MEYSYDSRAYLPSRAKHDSFLQPSSRDVNGSSRTSRSSTRLGVPHDNTVSRNKSVDERERRLYHPDAEYRSRSSVRREEIYPQTAPRAKSARRRTSTSRSGYPPSPSVEDENEAVRREYPRRRIPRQTSDEVLMPGAINQDPIMIELENHDRRYVHVPQDETKSSNPGSRRPRRPSDRVPPLKTDLEEPDLLARRKPSPYAFSGTPKSSTSSKSSDASSRRPTATSSRREPVMTPSTSEDERRRPRTSRPTNSSSDERNTSDSDIDLATAAKMRDRKPKARVSFHEPSLSSRPEVKRFSSDFGSPQDVRPKAPAGGPSLLKSALKPTASTPSSDDEAPRRRIDANAIPMPRSVPGVIPLPQHMREESGYGNRPTLQELTGAERARESRSTYPPVGSPRVVAQPSPLDYYSATGQPMRPSSPTMSDHDSRDFRDNGPPRQLNGYSDPENGYGSGSERRDHTDPRRRPHSRQGSLDSVGGARKEFLPPPPTSASALPYPVDDSMMLMPNHEHYIETPTRETAPALVVMPALSNQVYMASPHSSPKLSRDSGEFPLRPDAHSNLAPRRPPPSYEATSSLPPGALPPCPRMEPSQGHQDWYTLATNKNFDICPTCYDGIIRSSPFRHNFKYAEPRSPNALTRCDFGSPWFRAAWLLTLKRRRQDLGLIEALAALSTFDNECSPRKAPGPWYGLLSQDLSPISGFQICSRDFRYVEALFPALIGLFRRLPSGSSGHDARKCSMRISSDKFEDYLNFLEKIDEEARTTDLNKSPTLKKLLHFIRAGPPSSPPSTSSAKCSKDKHFRDATWHYMPALPEFTVCESCFDDVIWPDVKAGSELASQFHQVLTPLPAGVHTKGTSCQLYSDRMRYLWGQLVKKADKEGQREALKSLARKVRERWEIEGEIRAERRKIEDKLERNRKNVGRLAEDISKECWRRLQALDEDWAKWE